MQNELPAPANCEELLQNSHSAAMIAPQIVSPLVEQLKQKNEDLELNSKEAEKDIKVHTNQKQIKFQAVTKPSNFTSLQEQIKVKMDEVTIQKETNKQTDKLRGLLVEAAKLNYENAKYEQAIQLLQQALPIAIDISGNNSQDQASIIHNIGLNQYALKEFDGALENYNKSLQIRLNLDKESNAVARTLMNIGNLYASGKRDAKKALELYQESLRIKRKLFADKHIELAQPLQNIALILYNQRRCAQAEPLYQEALQIKEQAYGKCHFQVALTAYNLATCHFPIGKQSEGLEGYHKTFSIMKELQLWKHPQNQLFYLSNFKMIMKHMVGKPDVGLNLLLKAVKMIDVVFQKEYCDAEISGLRDRLSQKIKDLQ